ncbi:hypothetical protein SNE40_003901 [Patella caerulea]|uniref:Uncharacterized protein n=1 Tax=Patella caerulea TaxID=87958 RepID=A0AAN8KC62_PATCE
MSSYQGRQKGRMPEDDYLKVQTNYTYLLDHIKEPVKLGTKLFEKHVFGLDEKEEIQKIFRNSEDGRWAAADKLLTYVLSNCGDAYSRFIQCLRELGNIDVVNVLENTTNGKNKTNLMTEQDKTRHQLEELHKDHDLTKQELENLKKQMETLKTRQDGDSRQLLKKIKKREHELETYKKQTEEKEVLTKKRIDELETCIKTLTLNDEDTIQPQLLHGNLSGNTSHTSDDTLSGNTSHTSDGTLSGNTSHTSDDTLSGNTSHTSDGTLSGNTSHTSDNTLSGNTSHTSDDTLSGNTSHTSDDTLSGNTSHTSDDTLSGNTSHTSDDTLSGNTSHTSDDTLSGNTSHTSDKKDTRQQQLFDACQHGTLDDIKNMVNIDVNVRGGLSGETPLFICCRSSVSPVDKIKYLVSHQADINARDIYNITILHQACYYGTLSTVQYLVDDLHMDVNTTGYNNMTPLFTCCSSSVSPVDKIKYLVSHQADINARDSYNSTILHQACWFGTLSTVQYLVDCLHLDVHVKDEDGDTPLDCCRLSSIESHEKIKYITDQSPLFRYFFRR